VLALDIRQRDLFCPALFVCLIYRLFQPSMALAAGICIYLTANVWTQPLRLLFMKSYNRSIFVRRLVPQSLLYLLSHAIDS